MSDRVRRLGLILIALAGLAAGGVAWLTGRPDLAAVLWSAGTIPVAGGLLYQMTADLLAGRLGVDAVAFVAMAGALFLGEPLAAIVVAIMYAGGNVLEDYAQGRAERDLRVLIDRAPRIAHVLCGSAVRDVAVAEVKAGDRLLVQAGEVVPTDGIISGAGALVDESALSGEPLPVTRQAGEPVRSGAVNAGQAFEMTATAAAGESTYAGIVRLVTAAQTAKAPFIRLADRFALLMLPATLIVAGAAWLVSGDAVRALAVVVSATPCPLILAAPIAFIAGVSRAARLGILIKGGGPLEALARAHTVMFDKTGTLTVGGARLVAIETAPGADAATVLRLAASLEQASHHVIAGTIVQEARQRGLALSVPSAVSEALGSGLSGVIEAHRVSIGAYDLVCGQARPEPWAERALRRASWRSALSVFVAVDGHVIGALLLADELRREAPKVIASLREAGVARILMVTGDRADAAETIGAALDLDGVLANRVPADKVEAVATEQKLKPTIMVGDGINDAPALAAADVGIAMGARGASASSEAADVVLVVDRLDRVGDAIAIAKRARGIALQSIWVGLGLSGLAMLAAALGLLSPIEGALIQEGIDVAVILNALRALSPGRRMQHPRLSEEAAHALATEHRALEPQLHRLAEIADALEDASGAAAVSLIREARAIVAASLVAHEQHDEGVVYPRMKGFLIDGHGLAAMSRAHREIMHLARLIGRMADAVTPETADHYLLRDAQRAIEAMVALVNVHNAQEEDIYEHAAAQ